MMSTHSNMEISNIRFTSATPQDQSRGLLGYLSLTIDDMLHLDGVTLRRTLKGKLTLSFPARRDRQGKDHPILRPVGQDARKSIEEKIFAEIQTAIGAVDQ